MIYSTLPCFQAIRDISVVGKDSFLSAGNDGVIKHWRINLDDTSATVVSSVQAHNHFIYTLAMVEPDVWALGGESSGVKIFRHGQVIALLLRHDFEPPRLHFQAAE